jgi:membrane protein implicated in regulation of membrane protease activity
MSKITILALLTVLLLVQSGIALAYVGPGAGISVLGSLLSILATIFVAIGAIIFWPLRKYMKRRKTRRENPAGIETVEAGDDGKLDDRIKDDI